MVIAATICYGFAINIAAPLQARYGAVPLMARVLALATVLTRSLRRRRRGRFVLGTGPVGCGRSCSAWSGRGWPSR